MEELYCKNCGKSQGACCCNQCAVMSDIEIGLWQSKLDGKHIKVRSVGLTVVRYSDEGSNSVYDMGVSQLLGNYQLHEADSDKEPTSAKDWNPESLFMDGTKGYHYQSGDDTCPEIMKYYNPSKSPEKLVEGYLSSLKPEIRRKIEESNHDPVNNPSHYTSDPSGVECIQITRHRNFAVGNAIKYLWRCGLKDGNSNVQDLKKAAWYIQDEISRLEQL